MFQSLVGKLETTSTNCQHHPRLNVSIPCR